MNYDRALTDLWNEHKRITAMINALEVLKTQGSGSTEKLVGLSAASRQGHSLTGPGFQSLRPVQAALRHQSR